MDWREAWSLARTLIADGSSQLGAAVAGWDRPWPAQAWILADLYDAFAQANSKRRPKRYPRPNSEKPKRIGRATRSQREIRAALRARGHK